jgi:WD40 repeat protein
MFVRYRPRCTIVATHQSILHLSADGSRLVTIKPSKTKAGHGRPLRVWDTHTGEIVHELLRDAEVEPMWMRWPDDRHFAVLADRRLRLIDWRAGQEWRFEEPKGEQRFFMSPKGRWLFVHGSAAADPGGVIIDLKTRQISLHLHDLIPHFSRDDRWAFTRQGDKARIDVWDLAAAKKVTTISTDGAMLGFTNGASLVIGLSEQKTAGGASLRALEFWDLPSGQKRCRFEFSAAGFSFFSLNSSRFLAMCLYQGKTAKVILLEVETGQKRWETITADNGCEFSPDSGLFLCWEGDKDRTFTMYDVATGHKLWTRREAGLSITRFAGASGNLFLQEQGTKPFFFLDARTGETKETGPQNFRTANSLPFGTSDGKHFVIDGWPLRNREPYFWETWLEKRWPAWFGDDAKVAIVVESATGRELFRIRRSWMASQLSTDASTLVTLDSTEGDEASLIRIWDVQPNRAWTWALSSVAATVLLCFCLSRLLRALRNRKKTIAAANC